MYTRWEQLISDDTASDDRVSGKRTDVALCRAARNEFARQDATDVSVYLVTAKVERLSPVGGNGEESAYSVTLT